MDKNLLITQTTKLKTMSKFITVKTPNGISLIKVKEIQCIVTAKHGAGSLNVHVNAGSYASLSIIRMNGYIVESTQSVDEIRELIEDIEESMIKRHLSSK